MKLKIDAHIVDFSGLKNLDDKIEDIYLFGHYKKSVYLSYYGLDRFVIKVIWGTTKQSKTFYLSEIEDAEAFYNLLYKIPAKFDPKDLKELILNSEIGAKYDGTIGYWAGFSVDDHHDGEFSWTLFDKRGLFNRYPMRNSEYIKTFKTEKGAKMSLIKTLGL